MSDVTKGNFIYQSTFEYARDTQWKGSLKKYKLNLESLDGMKYNLFKDEWAVSNDKSINYISKFIKS